MLKRKALNKILITTTTVFILLTIYLIPISKEEEDRLEPSVTVEYKNSNHGYIYLLNDEKQLVRTNIFVKDNENLKDKIKVMVEALIISNNDLIPKGLSAIVPKNTKVLAVGIEEDVVSLNFSKDILNVKAEDVEKMIEAICNTIFDVDYIKGVIIYVNEVHINELVGIDIPDIITRDYGINKRYDLKKLDDVSKVVIFYIDEIYDNKYYVPVTKYLNDDRDKIKIIVDELSSSYVYEPNLISYLNNSVILTNYEIIEDRMTLNFNNSIFMKDGNVLEEVIYTISYSAFANYDINEVIFEVGANNFVKKVTKNIE